MRTPSRRGRLTAFWGDLISTGHLGRCSISKHVLVKVHIHRTVLHPRVLQQTFHAVIVVLLHVCLLSPRPERDDSLAKRSWGLNCM